MYAYLKKEGKDIATRSEAWTIIAQLRELLKQQRSISTGQRLLYLNSILFFIDILSSDNPMDSELKFAIVEKSEELMDLLFDNIDLV